MPVITFEYDELKSLGVDISKNELIDILPMTGSDIEDYDDETVKVEFFPNRPDQLSVEGVARNLKGFLGIETGMPVYDVKESGFKVFVEQDIEDIRPFIGFALIKNVNFDEKSIKKIMEFQEDLHWVIGRDRKKVAIGIHNLDVINGDFYYKAISGSHIRFKPLDYDVEMDLNHILSDHPKGNNYAHLLEDFDKYPIILDKEDNVLSMPPIINGELTKLTNNTHNILVDVTGLDEKAVNYALNIICSSFGEDGWEIESLDIVYNDRTVVTPDFTPKSKIVDLDKVCEYTGLNLGIDDVKELICRARMDAEIVSEHEIKVTIPAYRIDILHEVDVIENIGIQYGFDKMKPTLPDIFTVAYENPWFTSDKLIREVLLGLGFQEIMSLMLTSEDKHYHDLKLEETEHVCVTQPISQDRTMIRQSLLNGLFEFLEDNKHEDLPQKIFEIGDIVYLNADSENKVSTSKKVAGAIIHSSANFTEIKSNVTAFLESCGYEMNLDSYDHASFISGRCAKLTSEVKNKNSIKGFFGEVSPEVINNFNMEYPVVAFEIEFI